MTTYTETETEIEHAEREGADETQEETRWCRSCGTAATEDCDTGHKSRIVVEMATLICSCGYKTCGAITRFGLPEPTFHGQIEPIPSQYARDVRALEIRSEAS